MALCRNCGRSRCCSHINGPKSDDGVEHCSLCQVGILLDQAEATQKPQVSPSKSSDLLCCPYCGEAPYPHKGYFEILHKAGCFLSQPMAVRDPMPIYEKDIESWNNRAI